MSHPLWACPCSRCTPLRLYVALPGNRLRPALDFTHLPCLSRSGSALRKPSEAQICLGLRFVPFPGPSGSGVGRARSLRLWPFPAAQFPGSTAGVPSQAGDDRPEPPEGLVSKEACLHFGRQCLSWAAIAPFQPLRLWLPVAREGWSAAGYFCSILCSVRSPGSILCSSFSCGSYLTVWFASPS